MSTTQAQFTASRVYFDGFKTYGLVKCDEFEQWMYVAGRLNEVEFCRWIAPTVESMIAELAPSKSLLTGIIESSGVAREADGTATLTWEQLEGALNSTNRS